ILPLIGDVGNLDRRPRRCRLSGSSLSQMDRRHPKHLDNFDFHAMTRSQVKLFVGFIEFVDDSAIGSRKLDSVRNDRSENRFKLKSRADGLADRTEPFELADGTCQFASSLIQFFKQADVLDSDHRLVGEGFEESDLLVGERTNLPPTNYNYPDCNSLP